MGDLQREAYEKSAHEKVPGADLDHHDVYPGLVTVVAVAVVVLTAWGLIAFVGKLLLHHQ